MIWLIGACGIAVAGAVYFLIRWVQLRRGLSSMSVIEQRYAQIAEKRIAENKQSLREKLRLEMRRVGLADDLFPLFAAAAFLYLTVAVALKLLGLPDTATLLAAFPASAGAAYTGVLIRAQRRRAAFNRQLVDLLDLVTGQIQGGVGAERALMVVSPQMPEPIRTEMMRTLEMGRAGKDVIKAMRELRDRYPSRAFDMFIAALEIDRAEGQAIGPALRQASDLLKRDFALASEANAEVAQTKYEFLAVCGIVVALCGYIVLAGDDTTKNAYASPAGVIALVVAAANVGAGLFRFFRMLSKIKGDT